MWNSSLSDACNNAVSAVHESLSIVADCGIRFRTGMHCGPALIGNFGSHERYDYTLLGHTVNVAARLEPMNKEFRTLALMTSDVHSHVECHDMLWNHLREMASVKLIGNTDVMRVYELCLDPLDAEQRQAWSSALQCLEHDHGDPPAPQQRNLHL